MITIILLPAIPTIAAAQTEAAVVGDETEVALAPGPPFPRDEPRNLDEPTLAN
jgi:hypothetical protein